MWQDDNAAKTVQKRWITTFNSTTCENNTSNPACSDTSGNTATTYCTNLLTGSFENWRLPTIVELRNIVHYSKINPSIDSTFSNTRN